MESYTVIVLIFGIFILFLLVMLYFINRILQYKMRIDNSFVAVENCMGEFAVIIDDMVDFLEANLEYEKSYQNKLRQAWTLLSTIKNDKEGIHTWKKVEGEILSFIELENTYKNLGKNRDYLMIKEDVLKTRERLIYAFECYDKGVISYNNYRENKFNYILSKVCRIPEYDCYNK